MSEPDFDSEFPTEAELEFEENNFQIDKSCLETSTSIPSEQTKQQTVSSKILVLVPQLSINPPILQLEGIQEPRKCQSPNLLPHSSSSNELLTPPNQVCTTRDFCRRFFGGGGGGDDPFGNNTPLPEPVDLNLSLSVVGGLQEHVRYLQRAIMYPMRNKNAFKEWGLDPPKGIMFHGPPGTGKTLLAKSLASDLTKTMGKVSFFYQKGGECFSKWFGQSEQNLRSLFRAAKQAQPSIIFLDEIDGLCPNRESASQSSQAYASIVAALLGLIDSVSRGEVLVIGATNRLDAVDPAIRRPGRFDKDLAFPIPDEEGRKHIVSIHTKKWIRDQPNGELLNDIAKSAVGYTGADLEKLCRDAIVAAMSRNGDINLEHVRIDRRDWATAIQNMHHSSSNIFGSTIFISQPPSPAIRPLISNIVNDIIVRLEPLLPHEQKGHSTVQNNLSLKSLLVWESDPISHEFMNSTIMKGVLSHPTMNKFTTYVLSDEALLTNSTKARTLTEGIKKTIQQVVGSHKPCVIYIPRIALLDEIMKKEKLDSTFHTQLSRLRGPRILLLATSSQPLPRLSKGITNLFAGYRRSYKMRTPNTEERREFFSQIFQDLIGEPSGPQKKKAKVTQKSSLSSTDYSEVFEDFLERTVQLTIGDHSEFLFTLHQALKEAKDRFDKTESLNNKKLSDDFQSILERYSRDKLQQ